MSSWLQNNRKNTNLPLDEFYWKATSSGYGSNFLSFFMAYLFALHNKRNLYIQDTTSNISKNYHLIFDTFVRPSSVFFTEKRGIPVSIERGHFLNTYISSLSNDFICEKAISIFRFNSKTMEQIQKLISHIPPIEIGIHIRTGDKITSGEMGEIALEHYVSALRNIKQKDTVNVYIMTDNPEIIKKMNIMLDDSFKLFILEHPVTISGGHDQTMYNALDSTVKMHAFYHFLSEIYIMQRVPRCICTFSSNIGRFLYMTSEYREGISSVDLPIFNLLQHVPRA